MPTSQFFGVVQSSDQAGNLVTEVQIPNDRAVLSGNDVVVGCVYSTTAETMTVTDDKGGSYTKRCDVTRGARHQVWVRENVTDSPRIIKLQISGSGSTYVSGWWGQACGVGAWDVASTNSNGASATPDSGSFTPAAGALIITSCNCDDVPTFIAQWTPGSGYQAMCAELMKVFWFSQWKLHTSGAVTPSLTISATRGWTCCSISLAPDTTKGTAPTGLYMQSMTHNSFPGAGLTSPFKIQGPCSGADTIALLFEDSPGPNITGITDSAGNNWVKDADMPGDGGGGTNEFWHADRPTGSSTLIITVNYTGISGGSFVTFFAFKGTPAVAVDAGVTVSFKNTDTVNTAILGSIVDPSQPTGLIISLLGVESNTVLSVDIGNFISCTSTPTIASPADLMQNNGYCVQYVTSGAAIQRTWTLDNPPNNHQEINVFILQVPGPPVYDQEGFRWRADDGSESGATWLASQDTDISRAAATNTRLRLLSNATNVPANERLLWQYREEGDDQWRDIN